MGAQKSFNIIFPANLHFIGGPEKLPIPTVNCSLKTKMHYFPDLTKQFADYPLFLVKIIKLWMCCPRSLVSRSEEEILVLRLSTKTKCWIINKSPYERLHPKRSTSYPQRWQKSRAYVFYCNPPNIGTKMTVLMRAFKWYVIWPDQILLWWS